MVGDATGASFRLGDPVTVRLVEAAPVAGALRFEMLSHGGEAPANIAVRPAGRRKTSRAAAGAGTAGGAAERRDRKRRR